jgi:hypothetical protein
MVLSTPLRRGRPLPRSAGLAVQRGGRVLAEHLPGDGLRHVANSGYSVNVGGWSSLAVIDEDRILDGAEVTVVWGEEGGGSAKPTVERHVQAEVRATISTSPLAR